MFVNHLKSHFVPLNVDDPDAEAKRADELRRRQADVAAKIIAAVMRPDSHYVVLGDMNDPPDSVFLAPLTQSPELNLVSGLTNAEETRPSPGSPPPPTTLWTERFKASGKPAVYTLMDQVWLIPPLLQAWRARSSTAGPSSVATTVTTTRRGLCSISSRATGV
jgi:hypothetical protein